MQTTEGEHSKEKFETDVDPGELIKYNGREWIVRGHANREDFLLADPVERVAQYTTPFEIRDVIQRDVVSLDGLGPHEQYDLIN